MKDNPEKKDRTPQQQHPSAPADSKKSGQEPAPKEASAQSRVREIDPTPITEKPVTGKKPMTSEKGYQDVPPLQNEKDAQMEKFRLDSTDAPLTTFVGLPVEEDDFILKGGDRGPALMQDFHFHQKLLHFDKERIPERVVHARGTGVHGEFELLESMEKFTTADFLQRKGEKTPVFARLSTLQGSKGSADTVRDIRGFAVKFYTKEGNYDLMALSFPVFFIHDAIKFPDLVHATKPEPHNEIPQAQTAHDNYWDFISQNQETAHAVMWAMSDRGIPRSYRMMAGFGVNTFKWINRQGEVFFVKYHLKPVLGVHSFVWDECQKIAGKDPDFHRKDIMEAIEKGQFPEWEFGVQILPQKEEFKFDFDILDDTKLWPEELVPVTKVGRLTLNRNIDNFFSETEQVAFNPANLVPGMDISDDPVLQGRMFPYADTQMHRLGGPNYNQLAINRPIVPVTSYQRDGFSQQQVFRGKVNYHKNSHPDSLHLTPAEEGGFRHHPAPVEGNRVRTRSQAFLDFFSQPKMLYNSLEPVEQRHMIEAFQFELSKVRDPKIRQNVVNMFMNVDEGMAQQIASYLGLKAKKTPPITNAGDGPCQNYEFQGESVKRSEALSQEKTAKQAIGLKVAVLLTDDYDQETVDPIVKGLQEAGVLVEHIGEHLGLLPNGEELKATFFTTYPVLYDAVLVSSLEGLHPQNKPLVENFLNETFNHYKPLLVTEKGQRNLREKQQGQPGVSVIQDAQQALQEIAVMRFWERDTAR